MKQGIVARILCNVRGILSLPPLVIIRVHSCSFVVFRCSVVGCWVLDVEISSPPGRGQGWVGSSEFKVQSSRFKVQGSMFGVGCSVLDVDLSLSSGNPLCRIGDFPRRQEVAFPRFQLRRVFAYIRQVSRRLSDVRRNDSMKSKAAKGLSCRRHNLACSTTFHHCPASARHAFNLTQQNS